MRGGLLSPIVSFPKEKLERESRRVAERELGERAWHRENWRALWQCVGLAFLGVPIFGLSMALNDPHQADIARAAALFVGFAGPYFRWLALHVKRMERDE